MAEAQFHDVLIVGAGHAGAQAATSLRQLGFEGSIAMVGDEPDLPYERPALSKDYFAGEKAFERLLLRPAEFWNDRKVAVLLGRRVAVVDPAAHQVLLSDGEQLGFGRLIWAAGGAPRRLACDGADLGGLHVVRAKADVDRILDALGGAGDIAIIGGGYIGLEAAAVLSKLGKKATLIETQPRVLARVAGETVSRFYEAEHRAHGVDVRLGLGVAGFTGQEGRVSGVGLSDGQILPAQLVILGIGIVPAIAPLREAGAACGDGVHVDEHCRTSLPDIYAIGDCAAHVNAFADGARIRLESVQNANDQAIVAVKAIMGDPQPYHAVPWFWSDQYDLKLQTVGLSTGHDEVVVRGDPATRAFTAIYLKGGRVIALDCVNTVRDYVQGRKLVTARLSPPREKLADPGLTLKDIAASELAEA